MDSSVYGITFPKKKQLEEYLTLLEEAKKRDHRKIGKELKLNAIGIPLIAIVQGLVAYVVYFFFDLPSALL